MRTTTGALRYIRLDVQRRHTYTAPQAVACGASVGPAHVREYCELDDTSTALMRSAMNQLGMSAHAFHRVLKLARTIADLAGAEQIQAAHLVEAIHLRSTEETELTDYYIARARLSSAQIQGPLSRQRSRSQ